VQLYSIYKIQHQPVAQYFIFVY